jgi:1,4-alpha-glucan branching enzyme
MGTERAARAANDGMGSLLYPGPEGACRFRVWAPFAKSVSVEGAFTNWAAGAVELISEGNGNWAGQLRGVKHLDLYKYRIVNVGGPGNDDSKVWEQADARALQVESSAYASASYVIAPFDQSPRPTFTTPAFENFILYQLHVGSFTGLDDLRPAPVRGRTATFLDVVDKLPYIKSLGFNALALLPIGDVHNEAGGVGEGYGTCDMFAPEDCYGATPASAVADLLELVDAAHAAGVAVLFDVVYNHSATTDNRYWKYDGNSAGANGGGEYFVNGHDTEFGSGFGLWQQEVKDFFLDNARLFLRDYRIDGLRFDATQLVQPDAVEYIVGTLQREFPDKYLIAEYNPGDSDSAAPPVDPFLGLHFDATWDLAGPGQAFAALSGSDPVGNLLALIGDFQNPAPWCSVRYLTGSHDQIFDDGSDLSKRYLVERFGGRSNGWALAKARLAWALNVALPGTPMLFMGTEGAQDGFWNPALVDSAGDHRIDWGKMGDPIGGPMQRLVRDSNDLRWQHPALRGPAGSVTHTDLQGGVVAFKRYTQEGDLLLIVVNASDSQWAFHDYGVSTDGESGSWTEIFNSQAPDYGAVDSTGNFAEQLAITDGQLFINLPRWSLLVFRKL